MTTLEDETLKEIERIRGKFGYVSSHRYYIIVGQSVPLGFKTDDRKEAQILLEKAQKKFDREAYIIDNVDFGTYPDIDRINMRIKMKKAGLLKRKVNKRNVKK
jgi:hypothetical protein